MTDIFFSYSSKDRDRVRPIHDALVAQGFQVFWDQKVPAGQNWDNWIREHLTQSKCAIVFWSATSVGSDNVRHEAIVAKQQGKLVSVLLEELSAEQFPMGLYAQQAANLSRWDGDLGYEEWLKFRRDFEAKLTPAWVRRQIDELEAELVGERARREGAEHRDSVLQAQIAKEAKTQQELKRERNEAREEVAALKATVQELTRVRSQAEARETDTLQKIATLRTTVDELTRARSDAEQRLSKLRQTKAKEIVRSVSPFVIAAAVATVGIWTYQLIWPAPQPLPAVMSGSMEEAEQQRLKEEVQRQTKAAADADTKRQAAEKAAADADSKRKAAEAEQHGLKEEVQRQAKAVAEVQTRLQAAQTELQIQSKAATDADTTRKVAGEQQSLTLCRAEDATSLTGPFTKLCGVQATGAGIATGFQASLDECEQKCAGTYNCRVFTRNKLNGMCYLYNWVDYTSNSQFDSGERNSDRTTIRVDEMPTGINPFDNISANTLAECEAACVRSPKCKLFTRVKDGRCFLYQRPSGSFSQVQGYETGLLKARMR